jgi:anaerobic selenocysteine-containing dehydrogenase
MTNHWIDLKNATAFLVFSNPAENHPSAMQWINQARKPVAEGGKGAKVIVVDPRRTRMAAQADLYVRIRPGTDIAFVNGMIREAIERQEATISPLSTAHLKATASRTWRNETFGTGTLTWPNYSDGSFVLNSDTAPTDYVREAKTLSAGTASGMPVVAGMNPNGTYKAGYTTPSLYRETGGNQTVYEYLKFRVNDYIPATVADICGCTEGEFLAACDMYFDNSYAKTAAATYTASNYKAGSILYAMGTTQHTKGSHNTRDYCLLQMILGNMGKPGGGVNALRGIGNVQGSTDMGLLYGNTIGYNFAQPAAGQSHDAYMDNLFGDSFPEVYPTGVPVRFQQRGWHNMLHAWFHDGTTNIASSAAGMYAYYPKGNGLDHRSMFHQTGGITYDPDLGGNSVVGQAAVNVMPGYSSSKSTVNTMIVWGQNPRVTEANATNVEEGLENLDVLVVVDCHLSETAEAPRKTNGVTYFLPAATFAETYGTLTTSGRWIQWRNGAVPPKGNTKSDGEMVLRLAKALHANGGIYKDTTGNGATPWPNANYDASGLGTADGFDRLWGRYFLNAGTAQAAVNGSDMATFSLADSKKVAENVYKEYGAPLGGVLDSTTSRTWYGTLWIYSSASGGGKSGLGKGQQLAAWEPNVTAAAYPTGSIPDGAIEGHVTTDDEGKVTTFDGILAKSTNPWDAASPNDLGIHIYFAVAWLFNRRVFYNIGFTTGAAGDTLDLFVTPDQVSRFFVHYGAATPTEVFSNRTSGAVNYSWFYRKYSAFNDTNSRTPRHTEPHESPRGDLVASYGTIGIVSTEDYANTDAERHEFPLVLTTFRFTEHFQGGQMTRNVPWLNELVPAPTVEVNSYDALTYGIQNGNRVYLSTMRATDIGPFIAVVSSGVSTKQKVGKGVLAVPWHWGSRGLSTGPTANDLCIDALDGSTTMPETKACLCKISRVET